MVTLVHPNSLECFLFTKLKSQGKGIGQYMSRNETFQMTFIWRGAGDKLEIFSEDRFLVKRIAREGKE